VCIVTTFCDIYAFISVVCGVLYRGVCVVTGGMCSPGCGWGVLLWGLVVRGFLVLGVFLCVVFTVVHGLWMSSVVVRLAGG